MHLSELNEDLVTNLMLRDELHMEQDSMLVDLEDLTRYLCVWKEYLAYVFFFFNFFVPVNPLLFFLSLPIDSIIHNLSHDMEPSLLLSVYSAFHWMMV
jgi:hypothetical protein